MAYERTTGSSRKREARMRVNYLHISARIVHEPKTDAAGAIIGDNTHVERGRTYRRPKP